MMKRLLLGVALMSMTSACIGEKDVKLGAASGTAASGAANGVEVVNSDTLPPPDVSDINSSVRPYRIGAFDKLTVNVFGIEELSQKELQADASGRISMPLAGVIEAGGKTPGELEQEIEARLRHRYVRNPQVTVNLLETVSQVITVDGEVKQPGLYPVIGRMTLMQAVATAKGTSEFARLDDVVVFRTVRGQKMAALYNLKAIRRGAYSDPEVYANDVVIIGDSSARRRFKDILQVLPILTTPLILLLQK